MFCSKAASSLSWKLDDVLRDIGVFGGEGISPQPFLGYLRRKYGELYMLD